MSSTANPEGAAQARRTAVLLVVLFGIVSLLADMTYEGARSITGPFLKTLGASATVVGVVSGFGELIAYGMRLFSGRITDRIRRYWLITILGYSINLLAVPLLALAGNWILASMLIALERFGKSIRSPARDAMLSFASSRVGRGWTYGLHEALDQIGAVLGSLAVAAILYARSGNYRLGFAVLLVPAMLSLAMLAVGRLLYPNPANLEVKKRTVEWQGFKKRFWIYILAVSLVAMGFADFPLIAYHFQSKRLFSEATIPLLYATAMGVDAVAALLFGYLYDRIGAKTLVIAASVSSVFAPFVFLGGSGAAWAGMVIWGIGMGWQESVMRSVITDITPSDKRGSAFGIFNSVYGVAWFLGSALIGLLYGWSIAAVVVFSVGIQLLAVPFYVALALKKA